MHFPLGAEEKEDNDHLQSTHRVPDTLYTSLLKHEVHIIIPISRWGDWVLRTLSDLLQVTQLVKTWSQSWWTPESLLLLPCSTPGGKRRELLMGINYGVASWHTPDQQNTESRTSVHLGLFPFFMRLVLEKRENHTRRSLMMKQNDGFRPKEARFDPTLQGPFPALPSNQGWQRTL